MSIKCIIITAVLILFMSMEETAAQGRRERVYGEKFGNTLNLGLGIGGYSGYYHVLPVVDINYEFGAGRNFTLAPFITLFSYADDNYTELYTPLGVKGTYYLDQLFRAGNYWDFYIAGSLGIALVSTRWDPDYYGDRTYYHRGRPLYLDFHFGTEYHISRRVGIFLDLSTGVSTFGIAIH